MPVFIDTTSEPTCGIAICGRCCFKFKLADLYPDPNAPGLFVCKEDLDQFDPYRLPPPPPDKWNLPFVRPDVPLINPYGDVPPFPIPQSNPAFLNGTAPYLAVAPGD